MRRCRCRVWRAPCNTDIAPDDGSLVLGWVPWSTTPDRYAFYNMGFALSEVGPTRTRTLAFAHMAVSLPDVCHGWPKAAGAHHAPLATRPPKPHTFCAQYSCACLPAPVSYLGGPCMLHRSLPPLSLLFWMISRQGTPMTQLPGVESTRAVEFKLQPSLSGALETRGLLNFADEAWLGRAVTMLSVPCRALCVVSSPASHQAQQATLTPCTDALCGMLCPGLCLPCQCPGMPGVGNKEHDAPFNVDGEEMPPFDVHVRLLPRCLTFFAQPPALL